MAITLAKSSTTKYIGASTDTKPTAATHNTLPGATFYAYDTGIMYITYDGTNWVEKDTIVRLETSPTIDIGDVSIIDSSGVAVEKAEDAAHVSGDKGFMALGVRSDAATGSTSADGDYAAPTLDRFNGLRVGKPVFGEATLVAANNGSANWAQGIISPLDQKSTTGWLACLYGGVQTNDDWARINIPVDELLLTKLTSATWTYWMTNAETMGVNIVVWVHDATAPSKRAEITQLANVAGLAKAAGWNSHVLNTGTTQFFFYGENTTGTALVAGTQYTLAQFQADALFSLWTIYRITIEYGWEASGTFEEAYVADLNLNGIPILLKPDRGGSGRIANRFDTGAGALATALAPKTTCKLLSLALHLSSAATQQTFTATVDATRGTAYDTLLISEAMSGITDLVKIWEGGLDLRAEDEVDCAWTNTDTRTFGLTISYQTVF